MIHIVVGVGSSGPDADRRVRASLDRLEDDGRWSHLCSSGLYISPAAGGGTRHRFVNAAALLATSLHPQALLGALLGFEREAGRVRAQKDGGRALDLDLLHVSGLARATSRLALPHPRLKERRFALEPALECLRLAGRPTPVGLLRARRCLGSERLRLAG